VTAGVLDADGEARVVAAAKSLYFPDRTWSAILAAATKAGLDPSAADRLTLFAADHRVDQKAADAEELLELLAGMATPPAPATPPDWVFNDSRPSRGLRGRDLHVQRGPGPVSLETIARHVMLHRPGATELLEEGCARDLQMILAGILGMEATDEEVAAETERFRLRHGLHSDTALHDYLERNDLTADELGELLYQRALLRHLRAWLRVRRYRLGLGSLLLDELRLRDDYAPWADHAATHEAHLESLGEPGDLEPLEGLIREHLAVTGWQPDCAITTWAEDSDFADVYQAHAALARASRVRHHLAAIAADQQLWAAVGSALS
jgi:hypothetical protein